MSGGNAMHGGLPALSLVQRLRWRYPRATRAYSEARLLETVHDSLSTCATLAIVDEESVFRYAALAVLLTHDQKQSPFIQGVLVRILGNTDWDAKKRLDFVYKHVVGRQMSEQEGDFGKFFSPVNERV